MKRGKYMTTKFSGILLATILLCTFASASMAENTVRLEKRVLTGQVGSPVLIKIVADQTELPSGYMYSATAQILAAPDGEEATLLSGYPTIYMMATTPGEYRLGVRVNLVEKTTCGGASFQPLLNDEISVSITP